MHVDGEVLERLEWARVVAMAAAEVRTPMGRELAGGLRPLADSDALNRAHSRAAEMREAMARLGRLPIVAVESPALVLSALLVAGKTLAGRDIYETVRLVLVAQQTVAELEKLPPAQFPELAAAVAHFPDLSGITEAIEGNLTPAGQVEDHASPELARIRREIRRLQESVTETLGGLLRAEWTGPVLQDKFITVRNNRFVLPVRTDTPRRLPGIVHGSSSSEKTVFVEPMETVEMNNQLVRLRDEEEQEIEKVLAGYTELLRACREDIAATAARLGELDLLQSVAVWADRGGAVRPDLVPTGGLRLVRARHPVLETTLAAQAPPGVLVPLDVDLSREVRSLVISGPNAGGKTVALKTIGLLTLMAHAGLPVPAAEARIPLFDRLFADIGDEQSILGSLSTFASHVRNLATMIRAAQPPALALIDEIGAGTDPAEGAALGIAVLERLLAAGVHVVATTHHAAVKAWAYRAPGALNAACDFDEESLRPTYRLVSGVAGASIGLTMARQLGLDAAVVADAEQRLDPSGAAATQLLDSVRSLAADLERQRAGLVEHRRRLDREAAEREDRSRQVEAERRADWTLKVENLLREFRADAQRMLSRLADAKERRALEKERARREQELRQKFAEQAAAERRLAPAPTDWTPASGERVFVVSLNRDGVVRAVRERRVEVALGSAIFTAPLEDLRPGAPAPPPAPPGRLRRTPGGVEFSLAEREAPPELHLLGMRVDEALAALDRYLDDALLAGRDEVRIIHGFGAGILKKAVREHLKGHAQVASWREAAPNEGGGGATVVRLKEDDGL